MKILAPKELRVGNYVFAEVGMPSLELHCITSGDFIDIDSQRVAVTPVTLTEDWLLRLGFVKTPNGLMMEKNGFDFTFDERLDCWIEGVPLKIYFVHQIQNVYYALTNTELKWEI